MCLEISETENEPFENLGTLMRFNDIFRVVQNCIFFSTLNRANTTHGHCTNEHW